jgi:hypothetical protein
MRRLFFVAALCAPASAFAYHEQIHEQLDRLAQPPALLARELPAVGAEEVDRLISEVWNAGAGHSDRAIRAKFLARYPDREKFDRWAFKEFLGLNPDAPVGGIDVFDGIGAPITVGSVLAKASRWPDDDGRNRDRFAHDGDRRVQHDTFGRPVPADPRQLDMGSLSGTSSQAYAHYGLPKLAFSSDPDVLKKEPRRFLFPVTAYAWAREFAQMHTDLALIAASLPLPAAKTLAWIYVGNAHHYIEDVSNQIHTLQAIYPFFFDATIDSYKEELRTLGGVLGPRPDMVTIGVRIVTNHHLLCEELFMRHVTRALSGASEAPLVTQAVTAVGEGDPELDGALRELPADFATFITNAVIDRSSLEGGAVYEAIRALAVRQLSQWSGVFETGDDPDRFLKQPADPATLDRFYGLQKKAFARAGSAIRAHAARFVALSEGHGGDSANALLVLRESAADRLVRTQIEWLGQRDAAAMGYIPRLTKDKPINPWPLAALITIGVLGALGLGYARLRLAKKGAARRT